MKKTLLCLWLFLASGLMLTSCTKNDDSTIVLVGMEDYDDILSVIPESVQTQFLSDFGSIPHGLFIPPKIEGSYVVDPKQRVISNVESWPLQTVEPNAYLRFMGQHNGVVRMDFNEATETITDTVFVRGNGNDFVVYFIENKAYEVENDNHTYLVKLERGVVMKGEVTDNGLANFRYATIVRKIEDDSNGLIEQFPIGSYFIYKDGDGKALSQEW